MITVSISQSSLCHFRVHVACSEAWCSQPERFELSRKHRCRLLFIWDVPWNEASPFLQMRPDLHPPKGLLHFADGRLLFSFRVESTVFSTQHLGVVAVTFCCEQNTLFRKNTVTLSRNCSQRQGAGGWELSKFYELFRVLNTRITTSFSHFNWVALATWCSEHSCLVPRGKVPWVVLGKLHQFSTTLR